MDNQLWCGYGRVSTEEQAKFGISPEAQKEKIRKYAAWKEVEIFPIFFDDGVSGTKPIQDRPEGKKFLELISTGKIKHVVCTKQDRLFRSLGDCVATLEEWEGKISLHLIDEGGIIETTTPSGWLQVIMRGVFGEYEVRQTRTRVKDTLRHKREKGEVTNHSPYGWDAVDGKMVENEKEQEVIKLIRHQSQHASYGLIARTLNMGGDTPAKNGGKWYSQTIKNVLKGS